MIVRNTNKDYIFVHNFLRKIKAEFDRENDYYILPEHLNEADGLRTISLMRSGYIEPVEEGEGI